MLLNVDDLLFGTFLGWMILARIIYWLLYRGKPLPIQETSATINDELINQIWLKLQARKEENP